MAVSENRELGALVPWVVIRQCHLPTHLRRFAMASNSDEIVQQVSRISKLWSPT